MRLDCLPGLEQGGVEVNEAPLIVDVLGDAWDEPDTGVPPCLFCRREVPCECHPDAPESYDEQCMCSCGRCPL